MQMDPFPGIVTLPDTLNPYLYTLNNPVNFVDPSGRFFFIPLLVAGLIGGFLGGVAYYTLEMLPKLGCWNPGEALVYGSGGMLLGGMLATLLYGGQWAAPRIIAWGGRVAVPRIVAWAGSAYAAARVAAANSIPRTFNNLLPFARTLYPRLAGQYHWHHVIPQYLGGPANGLVVRINAAYHQLITNAFRTEWAYGKGIPSPERLAEILRDVYSKFPLP